MATYVRVLRAMHLQNKPRHVIATGLIRGTAEYTALGGRLVRNPYVLLRDIDDGVCDVSDARHPIFAARVVRCEGASAAAADTALRLQRFPFVRRIEVARSCTCSPQLLKYWAEQLDAVLVLEESLERCKRMWAADAPNVRLEALRPLELEPLDVL